MPMLMQLRNVAEQGRLGPLSASVESGEILHLVGPNGAGKSTLLTRMAGLSYGQGEVIFNDSPLSDWPAATLARHRALLVQQQVPPFAIPVWHYLTLHQHDKTRTALLESIAARLDLTDKLPRPASALSGGEWQRVRLAAVILQIHPEGNPQGQLLLLDEPMNSLDVAQQVALDGLLSELSAAGVTIVMSSHDLNHSLRHAHRVWLMCKGGLVASGPCDEVLMPQHLTTAYGVPFRCLDIEGHRMLIAAG